MKAFITGIHGQDGAFLARYLLSLGYTVYGGGRQRSEEPWRMDRLGILDDVELVDFDLLEPRAGGRVLSQIKPDELYNLAALSHVGSSFRTPEVVAQVNYMGVLHLLEWLKDNPYCRFYQASTSEMFGDSPAPQNENTPLNPQSPYAIAKTAAHNLCRMYREAYGLFVCCGILFNHESPLRGRRFVTTRILDGLPLALNGGPPLTLGNIDAKRDWGWAPEYVEAMHLMLQQPKAGDYVVGSGATYSVKNFVSAVAAELGFPLDWDGRTAMSAGKPVVLADQHEIRPLDVNNLQADIRRARDTLGWEPKVMFSELVRRLVNREMR